MIGGLNANVATADWSPWRGAFGGLGTALTAAPRVAYAAAADAPTPIWTHRAAAGVVMACFSPDDRQLLVSSVDNDVCSLAVGGVEKVVDFALPRTGSRHNYTRSYYLEDGRHIITGSCEEPVVRILRTTCGRKLRDVVVTSDGVDDERCRAHDERGRVYVQSLRGDPHHPYRFGVLVAESLGSKGEGRARVRGIDLLEDDAKTATAYI